MVIPILALAVLRVTTPSASCLAEGAPYLVKGFHQAPSGSGPRELVDVNGTLFFVAVGDSGTRAGVWRSDGTPGGTSMIAAGPAKHLTPAGMRLFFANTDAHELWVTDGTPGGSRRIIGFPASAFEPGPQDLLAAGEVVFFAANDGTGRALWRSDGTPGGTFKLGAPLPLGTGSGMRASTVAGGRLFFATPAGAVGNQVVELWVSDGSRAGTRRVTRLTSLSNRGPSFEGAAGRLYFASIEPVFGSEPWTSDGTLEGTHPLADVNPGPDGSYPTHFTGVGGRVFFLADGTLPQELWRTEGAGATKVADTEPIGIPFDPFTALGPCDLTASGDLLFYVQTDDFFGSGVLGSELFRSDGTAPGTRLVRDICPGACDSQPSSLTDVDGVLYFVAEDGMHGPEIWCSDGSAEGTHPVAGTARLGDPALLTRSGSLLFFTGQASLTGRELWAIPLRR